MSRCPRRSGRSSRRAPSPPPEPRVERRGRAFRWRRPAPWPVLRSPSNSLCPQLGPVVPMARVGVLVEVVRVGIRALVRELDDVADLGVDLLAHLLVVLLVRQAALLQLVLEGDDGVRLAPLLLVLGRSVLVRVDHRMASEAVAKRLDEARHRILARLLDYLARP